MLKPNKSSRNKITIGVAVLRLMFGITSGVGWLQRFAKPQLLNCILHLLPSPFYLDPFAPATHDNYIFGAGDILFQQLNRLSRFNLKSSTS